MRATSIRGPFVNILSDSRALNLRCARKGRVERGEKDNGEEEDKAGRRRIGLLRCINYAPLSIGKLVCAMVGAEEEGRDCVCCMNEGDGVKPEADTETESGEAEGRKREAAIKFTLSRQGRIDGRISSTQS